MKLQVGVIEYSSMWEQLLAQEGVPSEYVDLENLRKDDYTLIVINRSLNNEEQKTVEGYLLSGGAVLGFAGYLTGVCGTTSRKEQLDYLVSDHDEIFGDIQLIDLSVIGEIPREANCLRMQRNEFAVFAGPMGGGHAVVLPFDPAVAMSDERVANKNFYSLTERLPSERVSVVGKGEIRQLLHRSFEFLYRMRNLPYVHTWYFPNGVQNLFAFRVDTDGGSRQEVDELYHIALEHNIGMSWFLDVKSHEEWLQHFAFLSKQEIGVHCYEHQTYETFDANLKNISKAKHKLEQVGLSSNGFSAPYGIWNPALAKAIDKVMFEYSSEFSFLYDSFPFHPSNGLETFLTLQIPIHPICIGSLRKVGYSESQMKEYFKRVIDEKLLREEPLFFYHHPTHHSWDVVRYIFQYVEEKHIENTTMLEYARWWGKRLTYRPALSVEGDIISVTNTKHADDSVWIHIVRPDGAETFLPPLQRYSLDALHWSSPRKRYSPPADIRRMREFDPRGMLGNVFTTITRKLAGRKANE